MVQLRSTFGNTPHLLDITGKKALLLVNPLLKTHYQMLVDFMKNSADPVWETNRGDK